MGLLNARNLRRAKDLLDQNRHRVGDVVEKAGTQLDKVSKGKTANVTSKASEAAKKYSTSGNATHHGIDTPVADQSSVASGQQRQAEAAGAVTGVANALTNLMNKAAEKIESTDPSRAETTTREGDPLPPPPADATPTDRFDRG